MSNFNMFHASAFLGIGALSGYQTYMATNDPLLAGFSGVLSGVTSTLGMTLCAHIFDDSRGFSPLFAAVVVVAAGYGGYKIPKEMVINDFNERSKIETSQTNEQSRVEIENEIEQNVAKCGYSLTMPKFA